MKISDRVRIEPADPSDLDDIMRIEETSFTAPWTRKMFEVELTQNPFGRVLTARSEGGTLIGYICAWVVFEELRLMTLAVSPPQRRQGIGASLVRAALARGRQEGARRAVLEVRASNDAALALYEREGFRRQAVRQQYYTRPVEDAVLMQLDPMPEHGKG